MKYYFTSIWIAKIKKNMYTNNTKCWSRYKTTISVTYWSWELKMVWSLWKTVWQYLINIDLPYDPGITLLGIYPREIKTYPHTKTFYKCLFLWLCSVAQSCLPLCSSMDYIAHHQALLSMEFSRQEYWSGLTFPTPRDLPDPGIKPMSPELAGRFLPLCHANF